MPFVTPYIDVDFVAEYNAANSTDWVCADTRLVWIPSTGKYWLELGPRDGSYVDPAPGAWAIIDPVTRTIGGFSDPWDTISDGETYWYAIYSSYHDAVFAPAWTFTGGETKVLAKFDSDGTLAAQSGALDYMFRYLSANPVTGELYSIVSRALGWMEFCSFDTATCEPDHFVTIPTGVTTGLGGTETMIQDPRRLETNTAHDADGNFFYVVTETPGTTPGGDVYTNYRSTIYKFDQTTETGTSIYVTDTDVVAQLGCYRPDTNEVLVYLKSYTDSSRKGAWMDCSTGTLSTPETFVDTSPIWGSAYRTPVWNVATSRVLDIVFHYDALLGYYQGGADFDPADLDSEPNIYQVSDDSSVSYIVANGYGSQVWVSNYTWDGADHYYTRIWPGSVASRRWVNVNINMRRR